MENLNCGLYNDMDDLEPGYYTITQRKISVGKKKHFQLVCVDENGNELPKYIRITDPERIKQLDQAQWSD